MGDDNNYTPMYSSFSGYLNRANDIKKLGLADSTTKDMLNDLGSDYLYSNSLGDLNEQELNSNYQALFKNAGLAEQTASQMPWYKDSAMLGSIAGLGASLAQLAALPSQIDFAKTQSKALKQNIATAKEEQARRNKNISAFNSFNAG